MSDTVQLEEEWLANVRNRYLEAMSLTGRSGEEARAAVLLHDFPAVMRFAGSTVELLIASDEATASMRQGADRSALVRAVNGTRQAYAQSFHANEQAGLMVLAARRGGSLRREPWYRRLALRLGSWLVRG